MEKPVDKKRTVKIAAITIIILAAGYLAFRLIESRKEEAIDAAVERQNQVWQTREEALNAEIALLQQELRLQRDRIVSEAKLFETFGEEAGLISPGKRLNCDILERQIRSLCSYLDELNYVRASNLANGTFGLLANTQKDLSEKTPTIIGETRDLFTLLRNMAFFYRTLGKKRLNLIKDILIREAEIVEPAMVVFYTWFTHEENCGLGELSPPPFKVLYEYAGFFLNTIGGRSYLYRRGSKIRTLTAYYSVLILDRANDRALNPYGIDIRKYIGYLASDIENMKGLLFQKQYLSELQVLMEKYRF